MRSGPHLRYLLRALAWLVPLLALWWYLLLGPLMSALQVATETIFRLAGTNPAPQVTQAEGYWAIRVPVPESIGRRKEIQRMFGRVSASHPYTKVRSFQLQLPSNYPPLFTVTLPFFWALVLATGFTRHTWRACAIGSAALMTLAIVLMAFEVVQLFVKYTHLSFWGGLSEPLLRVGDVIVLNVIPYMTPVLLAVALQPDLRAMIFGGEAALKPVPAKSAPRSGRIRAQRRGRVEARASR